MQSTLDCQQAHVREVQAALSDISSDVSQYCAGNSTAVMAVTSTVDAMLSQVGAVGLAALSHVANVVVLCSMRVW